MVSRNELRDRYRQVMDRVDVAARRSDRLPENILVVAVTKMATPDQILQLLELGHKDLGENRAQQLGQRVAMTQEFVERHRLLSTSRKTEVPDQIRWHMIGTLQRNKVKTVIPLVRLIHSVDSLRLAEEIQNVAARQKVDVDILLQVNASGEKTKSGIALPAALHLAEQVDSMYNLSVRGLMTMAPLSDNPEDSRPAFERTAEVFTDICKQKVCEDFSILSMGMTNDFEVAIECGANVIRVGRAIFGDGD